MMTKISIAEESDAWCRRLGNFAPIVYQPAPMPGHSPRGGHRVFELASLVSRPPARSAHGRATPFLVAALFVAALGWPLSGAAQMGGGMGGGGMGGRGGHGSHGDRPPGAPASKNSDAVAHAPSPLRAMLGEMRKLRADLLLTSTQIEPWSKMDDALRECVELERSRAPALQPGAAIDGSLYIQDLADNQRALADAEGRFAAATKAALATLNPRQLQTTRGRLGDAIASVQTAAPSAP
ncbi:hypothetical protein [Rudaea sp.]|uniref:hypothetical protein n=1 Tax=Rudaea sp. TaxID=2136325 RepID=UPI002ED48AB3